MGPNNLQNVNGQIRPSPDAEPDCSKGASSNVCKVSASLDQLTIRLTGAKLQYKDINNHGYSDSAAAQAKISSEAAGSLV